MKKINFNRLAILGCCIALLMLASVTNSLSQTKDSPIISILPVQVISNQSVVPTSGSMLARKSDGVFMTLNSSGLVPGTVATAWFAIFNNPQFCANTPCGPADMNNPMVQGSTVNGGGRIVGNDGTASFSGFRAVGDTTGIFSGPGLLNPLTAEIHLVTRTHGTAFSLQFHPDLLAQQLTMFNGGCPPNPCASIYISRHLP